MRIWRLRGAKQRNSRAELADLASATPVGQPRTRWKARMKKRAFVASFFIYGAEGGIWRPLLRSPHRLRRFGCARYGSATRVARGITTCLWGTSPTTAGRDAHFKSVLPPV